MRALQSQPTVSPTLIHHIQRRHITIKPNVKVWTNIHLNTGKILIREFFYYKKAINGNEILFENGDRDEFDTIILCTGYKIDLGYLHQELQDIVFKDKEKTVLNVSYWYD